MKIDCLTGNEEKRRVEIVRGVARTEMGAVVFFRGRCSLGCDKLDAEKRRARQGSCLKEHRESYLGARQC